MVGVAKTGVPGLSILTVPVMVLIVGDARLSAGWMLPILCFADLFAVYYWRRHAAASKLFSLAPWVLIGMAAGAMTLSLPERSLRPIVGSVILVMFCLYLWRRYHATDSTPAAHPLPGEVLWARTGNAATHPSDSRTVPIQNALANDGRHRSAAIQSPQHGGPA